MGIPTENRIENERYLPEYRLYVSGFNTSPYGIEWMRFESDSPVNNIIQKVPHIAFEVDDLDLELSRGCFEILTPPNSPGEGTRVAMSSIRKVVVFHTSLINAVGSMSTKGVQLMKPKAGSSMIKVKRLENSILADPEYYHKGESVNAFGFHLHKYLKISSMISSPTFLPVPV